MLVKKWSESEDYTHAFFTVPIILYIGWSRRQSFIDGRGWPITGLIVLTLATVFYILSLQLQIPSFIALSMGLTVFGAILYMSGASVVIEMVIPLLLLLFVIALVVVFALQRVLEHWETPKVVLNNL
ncbi:MAG: exosortase/archaeosortase family protein [Desulfobulbaceae bacterium]|nr:MAG: exosortase/archaeosortase family protein [Desulfobulbaceae bacterium]